MVFSSFLLLVSFDGEVETTAGGAEGSGMPEKASAEEGTKERAATPSASFATPRAREERSAAGVVVEVASALFPLFFASARCRDAWMRS